ncbi:MAG: calcium-translocating P-type ATPase, PMCA-type [bacterium]|nr:calcium-translocating P-type ATPase, PMCA-type [bacterium]
MGLTEKEVVESRKKYGSNEITKKNNNSFFKLLIESLSDPIIKILLIALAIKVVFLFKNFDWYETLGIVIAIFLASFISSISEYGSNKAFERLQEESQRTYAKVIRSGKLQKILSKDVVVKDLVVLESGDKVPADGYIKEGFLSIDESFITGEAKEVNKKYSDNHNEVYSGSTIYKGSAKVIITNVGDKTFIGGISSDIQTKGGESPLKGRLRTLAKSISKLGYIGAILASISYLFMQIVVKNNYNLDLIVDTLKNIPLMTNYLIYTLTLTVTIIIVAVPEGLPMMITLVLSSNMKKMLKDNVLVRKLVGIETSGSLNTLLCDKTGTLTLGKLNVKYIVTKDNKIFKNKNEIKIYKKYYDVLIKSLYLNNETILSSGNLIGGNTTDRAIKNFIGEDIINDKIIQKKLFSSEDKYSMVQTNEYYFYKGASEVILNKCKNYLDINGNIKKIESKSYIENMIKTYMEKGYRVLVNAYGKDENNLIFINLIIISDTIRPEAKHSLELIKSAGIKVIMITGDAKQTAINIAKELNLHESNSIALTHDELEKLSDDEIVKIYPKLSVIARALPQDKSRLVSIFQTYGLVVGMTGDGVNDALALKKSDVGFALGSGSEVSKDASDIVILDNNIFSICKAILYGRTIFKSIRKFIIYQLTVNICALILSIVGVWVGISTPITIIQMLWLNMIMDTFAGLAFSYEPPLKEYLYEKPKSKNEPIMNKYMFNQILVNGSYSALLCLLFLKLPIISHFIRFSEGNKFLYTAYFALFIFLGICNSFASRTHRLNIFANILKNKVFLLINIFIFFAQIYIIYFGGNLFRTYGLTSKELIFVFILSLTIFPIDFIRKKILKKKNIQIGV